MTHAGGRPSEYGQDTIDEAIQYFNIARPNEDEVIPSIEGLSLYLNISRSTIYEWISQEDKEEFSDIVGRILAKQGKTLVNNGLKGTFNSSIAKVMLTKHGYRDSIETTGKDGKDLIPEVSLSAIELAQQLNDLDKQRRLNQIPRSNGADTESLGTEA